MPRPDRAERRTQADRSKTTRAALIRTGRELFGTHGYAGVSGEQLVGGAGVTRGALYHHFGDKRGLFVAVLEEVEAENLAELAELLDGVDPITGMAAAIERFLDFCRNPELVRITMTDAPTVLGWQDWRKLEQRYGLGLIADALHDAIERGYVRPVPVSVTAQLLLVAIVEAGMIVAHADDQQAAATDARAALTQLIAGLLTSPTPR